MSFHIRVEPMPDNPARHSRIGDRSGNWRVVVSGQQKDRNSHNSVASEVHSEDLSYHQAASVAVQLESELSTH